MLFGKKTALTLSSLVFLSIVSACSSNVVPSSVSLKGDSNFQDSNLVTRLSSTVTQSKQDPSHFYIDAGKGQKTGASFSVKLNFANGGAFKTKAANDSFSGTPMAMIADVTHLKVALIDSATSPVDLTGAVTVGGSTTTLLAKTGSSPTITFTNVPNSTNSYWIAAAALQSGTNITKVSAPLDDATHGRFYVTSTGGDAGLPGSVDVNKTGDGTTTPFQYSVTSTDALGMSLTLRDATGATIGSDVTVTNGGDRLTTIIPS